MENGHRLRKNVVCVDQKTCDKDSGQFQVISGTGTGTLIDVGIPELDGRVVITCAHVVLPNEGFRMGSNNIKESLLSTNGWNEIISIDSQKLSHFKWIDAGYLSSNGRFGFGKYDTTCSVKAECQRGNFLDNIPITDIYLLTGDDEGTICYDIAICILKEPVKYKEAIVPGVELNKLNVFTESDKISTIYPYHFSTNVLSKVIGYGLTGLKGVVFDHLVLGFSDEQNQSFWGLNIKKVITLNGLDLNGQGVFQNMHGCNCAECLRRKMELSLSLVKVKCRPHIQLHKEYIDQATDYFQKAKASALAEKSGAVKFFSKEVRRFLEMAKNEKNEIESKIIGIIAENRECLEQFRATKPSYALPLARSGFSGSLVVRKRDDENYDAIGIYSGPLFTGEIKSFIKNATRYHHNCCVASR
ncbi:MAG: hypothetical protein LBF34_05315 [Puniceicoccales bacterium]|jgi:hypothetical protein|nr:hypothetical protein [Puniceicoccales bacterium]